MKQSIGNIGVGLKQGPKYCNFKAIKRLPTSPHSPTAMQMQHVYKNNKQPANISFHRKKNTPNHALEN